MNEHCKDCYFYAMRNDGSVIYGSPVSDYALKEITKENENCWMHEPFADEGQKEIALFGQNAWQMAMNVGRKL